MGEGGRESEADNNTRTRESEIESLKWRKVVMVGRGEGRVEGSERAMVGLVPGRSGGVRGGRN